MTGLGMTDAEREQYELERQKRRTEAQCAKCEKNLDHLMKYSGFHLIGLGFEIPWL
jgi:hypothetical protein